MSTPVAQRSDTVEVHKLGCKEHLAGCKPNSAVSQLASSLVNEPIDKALAIPANSQQAFSLPPRGTLSQSNIYPENFTKSKIRKNSMRLKDADKPDSMLSLPANSHEICEPLDKDADRNGDTKDISHVSSSSSIAVSSYSLLELHLSRVNSLGEFKMENIHGLSHPPDTSLPINSANEWKPREKESLLQGLSEKTVHPNNSFEESELMDRENLFQPPLEDAIHRNNSYDICTENREVDDVSTPVLPDHSIEEQVQLDMGTENLCESSCKPASSSDGYAQALLSVPEHLNSPNEDTPSEEDAARTPVHVTRYLSDRVPSRWSGGMVVNNMGYKPISYNFPSDSDVRTDHVDVCLKNPDQHDRSVSPPVGTSGMKTVSTGMTDEDLAMYQEVKEMAHNTATPDFEGGKDLVLLSVAVPLVC